MMLPCPVRGFLVFCQNHVGRSASAPPPTPAGVFEAPEQTALK